MKSYIITLILGWLISPHIFAADTLRNKKQFIDFTLKSMELFSSPLSEARRQLLAEQLYQVTDKMKEEDARRAFVFIIGIESRFNPEIKNSGKGAIGIAQIMPAYATEFGKLCGMSLVAADLHDYLLNLTVGGCLFYSLYEKYGHSTYLAAAAYNAGARGAAAAKTMGKLSPETNNYIRQLAVAKELIK